MSKTKMHYILTATGVTASLIKTDDEGVQSTVKTATFNVGDVPAELNDGETTKSLAAYGLSKILQDRTSATDVADKLADMEEVFTLLKEGKWRVRKEGGASKKAAIDPIFAQAVAEIKGVSLAAATMALQQLETEQRKALRSLPAIQDKVKELRDAGEKGAQDLLDSFNA